MKVLHTISGLSVNSGGPSTCTYNLLKGLRKINVDVDILTLESKNVTDKIIGNDSFIKVVSNDSISPLLYSRNFEKFLRNNGNYDLYHANGLWTLPSHVTSKCARKRNLPCVIAPHGMLYPEAMKISSWKKRITLSLFQHRDLIRTTCLQATSLSELKHIRNFGLTNPIAVVPNCLETDIFTEYIRSPNIIKRFGFVGRLSRIKNLDHLLRTWSKVGNLTSNAELVIIGSGDKIYEEELRKYVDHEKLKNVHFLGFMNGEPLRQMINTLDFLVLPSRSENFGMVVLEALMEKVPVIASKGTPWEELNTHNCGWWVDNDIDTLTSTIEKAINTSESTRQEMGKNGQRLVLDNYSVDVVSEKMKKLYEWILNGGNKPDFVYL